MTGLFKRCYNLQYSRQQRAIERWEQEREKGIARFAIRQSLIFPVIMTVVNDVSGYASDGRVPVLRIRWMIFYWFIGIIGGFIGWSNQESKYRRALANRRQSYGDNKIILR